MRIQFTPAVSDTVIEALRQKVGKNTPAEVRAWIEDTLGDRVNEFVVRELLRELSS